MIRRGLVALLSIVAVVGGRRVKLTWNDEVVPVSRSGAETLDLVITHPAGFDRAS